MRGSATGLWYEELGTTSQVTACDFCDRSGLPATVVLLAHSEDDEPVGNKYACRGCAATWAAKPARRSRKRDPRYR